MNFEHTEDRRMLSDMLRRFVSEQYDFATRERHAQSAQGYSVEFWRRYAELGAIGIDVVGEHIAGHRLARYRRGTVPNSRGLLTIHQLRDTLGRGGHLRILLGHLRLLRCIQRRRWPCSCGGRGCRCRSARRSGSGSGCLRESAGGRYGQGQHHQQTTGSHSSLHDAFS
ncbi:hypothetical protein D9M71_611250 [compost metagenome]